MRLLCHRFFYALRPPRPLAHRIDAFAEELAAGQKRLRPDHLHVTLGITEDYPDVPADVVRGLAAAGALAAKESRPFKLRLDQLCGSDRSVALRPRLSNPALFALIGALDKAMRQSGIVPRADWRASPHLTLFYTKDQPFWRPCQGFEWHADELVLVQSNVGLTEHVLLDRWPLAGCDAQMRFAGFG